MGSPVKKSEELQSPREHSSAGLGCSEVVELEDPEDSVKPPTGARSIELFGFEVGRACQRRPRKVIVDKIAYLKAALAKEENEAQQANIIACLKAVEDGKSFGMDDIFCGGKMINFDDWVPAMGPWYAMQVLSERPFTIY